MPTVKFYTLGCKVNQYETQNIREQFINTGFKELDNSFPADIYVINTCTVTHQADSDSLGYIRRSIRENPQAKVIVTGCLTELDAPKIKAIKKSILIFKNKDKDRTVNLLNRIKKHKNLGITYFKNHTRAFLKIQDGCNNSCSYCKVPLVRGRSRSKKLSFIMQEAKNLVKNGFKEIVLCGVCLGSYGRDLKPKINLINVIEGLERVDGLYRIRLSSIEARDVCGLLIDKLKNSKKLCPHLHIPFQSGDDDILKRMNRRYNQAYYLNLIRKVRKAIPDIAITTDIIVGFPGEKEDNFNHTIKLIKEVMPLKAHIFPFSPREKTKASSLLKDDLSFDTIKERMLRLNDIAHKAAHNYKTKFLGRLMPVLFETRFKKNPQFWQGHTGHYINVLVKHRGDLSNKIIPVKLQEIKEDYVVGDLY